MPSVKSHGLLNDWFQWRFMGPRGFFHSLNHQCYSWLISGGLVGVCYIWLSNSVWAIRYPIKDPILLGGLTFSIYSNESFHGQDYHRFLIIWLYCFPEYFLEKSKMNFLPGQPNWNQSIIGKSLISLYLMCLMEQKVESIHLHF
jgi:hypothetical protein